MPDKKIQIYDETNAPLQVVGIRLELYDARTKTYVDGADSDDLNPGAVPSNTWGVVLSFPSGATPLDVYVSDPSYNYPGNTMRYLNGDLRDEVLMDLLQLPSGPGGQTAPPANPSVPDINDWVDSAPDWTASEKEAVRNLILNYATVVAPESHRIESLQRFRDMAANWEAALERLGFPPQSLASMLATNQYLPG